MQNTTAACSGAKFVLRGNLFENGLPILQANLVWAPGQPRSEGVHDAAHHGQQLDADVPDSGQHSTATRAQHGRFTACTSYTCTATACVTDAAQLRHESINKPWRGFMYTASPTEARVWPRR